MDERKIIAKVGGEKEGYLLEFCADGIYLTVYPKDGTGLMFEVSDMRRVLKDFSVSDYDLMAMTDALRKNDGVPVYLGKDFTLPQGYSSQAADEEVDQEALQEHVEYGKVIVEIASDRLSAAIRFDVAGKQSIPTAEMIYEALQAKMSDMVLMMRLLRKQVIPVVLRRWPRERLLRMGRMLRLSVSLM